MVEKGTGRSRGFGFVSFAETEAANLAIAEMDGHQVSQWLLPTPALGAATAGTL